MTGKQWSSIGYVLLAIICVFIIWPGRTVSAANNESDEDSRRPLRPVILVHGMSSSPEFAWAVPDTAPSYGDGISMTGLTDAELVRTSHKNGFFRAFVQAGYRPGRDLFWLDYAARSTGDYVFVAESMLQPFVEEVLARTGAASVDIVAHSMGGLVARYYVEQMAGSSRVHQLVMIATPQRGSFAANLLRTIETVQRHPFPGYAAAEPDWQANDRQDRPSDSEDENEDEYIERLAWHYFYPLNLMYTWTARFLPPPGQWTKPLSFLEWFAKEYPVEFAESFVLVQKDTDLSRYGLSRAYMNLLSLAVAREGIQSHALPLPQPAYGNVWKNMQVWLRQLWDTVRSRFVAWAGRQAAAVGKSQLGLPQRAAAIDRLISEQTFLSTVTTPPEVTANAFLASFNEQGEALAPSRITRYVHIAGEVPTLWPLLFPDIRANDWVVETDATRLALGPNDLWIHWEGQAEAGHNALLYNRALQERVLAELKQDFTLDYVLDDYAERSVALGVAQGRQPWSGRRLWPADAPSGSEPRVLVPEAERLPPPDGAVANGPPFAWQHATNVRPVSKPGELILFDLDVGLPSVRFLGDMERYPFIEVDYHSRLTTNKRALIEKRAGLPNYPPQLQLSGPSRWIVGRPATYCLTVRMIPEPYLESVDVRFDPAPCFQVRWKRPGIFTVRAAVDITYRFLAEEQVITLRNTYVREVAVDVLATSLLP